MAGSPVIGKANAFGWSELNSRGVDKAKPFYKKVFGWGEKKSEVAEGMEYTEFLAGGESIPGCMEMNPMVPAGRRTSDAQLVRHIRSWLSAGAASHSIHRTVRVSASYIASTPLISCLPNLSHIPA